MAVIASTLDPVEHLLDGSEVVLLDGLDDDRPAPPALEQGATVVLTCGRVDQQVVGRVAALVNSAAALVVVLCEEVELAQIRALLSAGARGVVARGDMERTLLPAVQVARGGHVSYPAHAARTVNRGTLSIRERQAVGLVLLGLTNREIAQRLFVAESTVKSHLSSAFAKLGVRSRHEAMELILDPACGMGTGILTLDVEQIDGPGYSGSKQP